MAKSIKAIIIFAERPDLGLIKLRGIAKKTSTILEIGKKALHASSALLRLPSSKNNNKVGFAEISVVSIIVGNFFQLEIRTL